MDRELVFILSTVFGGFAVVMAVLFFLVNWGSDVSCHARWEDKFKPEYTIMGGCTIEVDGVRIPAANYRVL